MSEHAKHNFSQSVNSDADAQAGAAVYRKLLLSVYDLYVLGFSNTYAWECPSSEILTFYNQNISSCHLDIGVGTGYFLDHCRFPTKRPKIVLGDLNPNCLQVTQARLSRYNAKTVQLNILEPITDKLHGTFDSIGINYVFHCLPGDFSTKGIVFKHLKSVLNPGGVLFGTTLMGEGVPSNSIARFLKGLYNKKKIFSNLSDSESSLRDALAKEFDDFTVRIRGNVAFFRAVKSS